MTGRFISIEGTDGSGKTTQMEMIKQYLHKKGREVLFLREPGGTPISEKIRELILDPTHGEMSNVTEMLLYAAARAQLVEQVIKPALDRGKFVVCDRFVDSSYVYQGFGRGLGLETVEKVNHYAICGILPQVTLFLDIDPEVAMQRRQNVSALDRIEKEKLSFHRDVYKGYKKLSGCYPARFKAIDAAREPEAIFLDIKKELDRLLEEG